MKKLLVLILALIIAGCQRVPEESCMAVEFTKTNGQGIYYGYISDVDLAIHGEYSFCAFINTDGVSVDAQGIIASHSDDGGVIFFLRNNHLRLYDSLFSGNEVACWETDNAITTGTFVHVCATYTSKYDEEAKLYVSGSIEASSELYYNNVTSNLKDTGTNPLVVIGNWKTDTVNFTNPFDGKIQDVRIYNRILSQTEISTLYNSRCQRVVMNGLVFWAPLTGASGTQSFDGLQLSYENIIPDVIGGAQGFPYGGPVGRASTIQTIGGQ